MYKLIEISKMLNNYLEGKVKFDVPVVAILPCNTFSIYGAQKSEEHGIWILEGSGEWHGPLMSTQVNGEILIDALYDRLKMIAETPIVAL